MRWRLFDPKPLTDVEADDLQRLVTDEIEEGYFVAYKSVWEPRKVARAAASFANTWGGTLVVGMEAEGLKPTKLVGIEAEGGLEERVVNTVRTSVAPVPAFRAPCDCPRSSVAWGGCRCSWSTRSATSRSTPRPRTSCSCWSPPATSGHR